VKRDPDRPAVVEPRTEVRVQAGVQADRLHELRRVRRDREPVHPPVPHVRRREDRASRRRRHPQCVRGRDADQQRARGQRESSSHVTGIETVTRVPSPSRLVSAIVPPCCSTSAREIARPSPVPGIARCVAVDARKKREKTCPCSSGGMPIPVSATVTTTESPLPATLTVTAPPSF